MSSLGSDKEAQDPPPPPLTAAQKARIKRSPEHRRLRHATYGSLAIGVLGPIANVTCLVFGAVWARYILKQDRWFIFHYVVAAVLSTLWAGYTAFLYYHVRCGGFPDQIKLDIGWIMMSDAFACCFLFYLCYKMRTYGIPDMFDLACVSGCGAKLQFVKLSPLVLAITSIVLGLVQLWLCIVVYKSPLVQIPLDSHGMPMLQNPENGQPLPIGPDGKPILPAWLQPPKVKSSSTKPTSVKRSSSGRSSSAPSRSAPDAPSPFAAGEDSDMSEGEDAEERLLQQKAAKDAHALGRHHRSSRRSSRRSRHR
ncbi:hypothetical protein JCM10908_005225 [Rhodotorula pacifica]|uniref:uncharacterized protein n=1 Tax=Rhodotorula pacifica TaxID=1495444 RepID=UPI00317DD791